jgi:ribosomal protein L34
MTVTSPLTEQPRRIQRRRTKGWRLPENAVIVSRPSRFGNPFTIKDAIEAEFTEPHRACAENFAEWLRVGTAGGWYEETYRIGRQVLDRRRVLADLHLLRGKDLACTCPLPKPGQPDHCHAAVLLNLANQPTA